MEGVKWYGSGPLPEELATTAEMFSNPIGIWYGTRLARVGQTYYIVLLAMKINSFGRIALCKWDHRIQHNHQGREGMRRDGRRLKVEGEDGIGLR